MPNPWSSIASLRKACSPRTASGVAAGAHSFDAPFDLIETQSHSPRILWACRTCEKIRQSFVGALRNRQSNQLLDFRPASVRHPQGKHIHFADQAFRSLQVTCGSRSPRLVHFEFRKTPEVPQIWNRMGPQSRKINVGGKFLSRFQTARVSW